MHASAIHDTVNSFPQGNLFFINYKQKKTTRFEWSLILVLYFVLHQQLFFDWFHCWEKQNVTN